MQEGRVNTGAPCLACTHACSRPKQAAAAHSHPPASTRYLHPPTLWRGGGVRVDVTYVARGQPCLRQRPPHRQLRAGAIRGRLRDVVGVARHAAAADLQQRAACVDGCAVCVWVGARCIAASVHRQQRQQQLLKRSARPSPPSPSPLPPPFQGAPLHRCAHPAPWRAPRPPTQRRLHREDRMAVGNTAWERCARAAAQGSTPALNAPCHPPRASTPRGRHTRPPPPSPPPTCTLSHDEPVPPSVKRPRSSPRLVVEPGGEGLEPAEPGEGHGVDARLGAARNHHARVPTSDHAAHAWGMGEGGEGGSGLVAGRGGEKGGGSGQECRCCSAAPDPKYSPLFSGTLAGPT